jgi:fucose permease
MKEALFTKPAARVTWFCSAFLLGYVGIEVALGGWIVVFMTRVRDGAAFASGMTATGFWMGLTVGRVTLGFVTPRIGEKLAIAVSSILCFPEFRTRSSIKLIWGKSFLLIK